MKTLCDYKMVDGVITCSRCGDVTRELSMRRICDAVPQEKSKTPSPKTWQEQICETCLSYMGKQRCKLIGLGCQKDYKRALRKNKCPMKKWERKQMPEAKQKWSYGVTTIPLRVNNGLLKRTLDSLAAGGFTSPIIFVDGKLDLVPSWLSKYTIVERGKNIRTFGNWIMSAWEVYLRNPEGELFAVFQDDFVTVRNLRSYLEKVAYPDRGYLNLYTFPANKKEKTGFYLSNQKGLGAVALVFNNEAIRTILQSDHMVNRPLNAKRGWRSVDGGIVTGMKKEGWREYVHGPSLVQHTGLKSSMGNGKHALAPNFPGEDFDARSLINQTKPTKERIGLIGYNTASGLGEVCRQIATYGEVKAWLVQPHKHWKPQHTRYPGVEMIIGTDKRKVEMFLKQVDTIVFPETPFAPGLLDRARELDKRIVCVPMIEWTPVGQWLGQVDLFMCPTSQCYETLKGEVPCAMFPWPFDTSRFTFRQREKCTRFLFINGRGGWHGRKGASIIKQAKELWPEMPLVVRSQRSEQWPQGTEVLPPANDNSQLYDEGDVLLMPHAVDGIGLGLLEACSAGLPVIATDGPPWNEHPLLDKIPATSKRVRVKRIMDWYTPDAAALVEICKRWLGKDISEHSMEAKRYADSNRWQNRIDEFTGLVRTGKHRVALPFTSSAIGAE